MSTGFSLEITATKLGSSRRYIALIDRNNADIVAECRAIVYPGGVCDLEHLMIEAAFRNASAAHALTIVHAIITRAAIEENAVEYFCWGMRHTELVGLLPDILPYSLYFTERGEAIKAEEARERLERHRFVLWRGFASTPQQPVRGIIPVNSVPVRTVLRDEISTLCEREEFSREEIQLLVQHFLGRRLDELSHTSLFEPGGLLDRFGHCAERRPE